MPFNLNFAHQDRAVVETQRPKESSLKIGNEKLIKADNPIILYRRWWEKLKESTQKSLIEK